ncbi:hypothetical protein ACI7RC_18750 [Brevibacillus sp. B_LB10_24]|uniref:hypothetical protein n=1 Tax=Brevibacillus sp. B_LB10_24 TaxID=3380645 RepID=UPI0038BCFA9B
MGETIVSLALAAIMLMPFGFGESVQVAYANSSLSHEEHANNIHNTTTSLTNEQAAMIFAKIKSHILTKYAGIYSFDHFSVEFVNEKMENGKISIDVNVDVDMTLIRHPADSPYVKEMQAALSASGSAKEKEMGQREIDAFLKEVEPYYHTPSPSAFLYRIELANPSGTAKSLSNDVPFTLYYREDITTEETILTPVS